MEVSLHIAAPNIEDDTAFDIGDRRIFPFTLLEALYSNRFPFFRWKGPSNWRPDRFKMVPVKASSDDNYVYFHFKLSSNIFVFGVEKSILLEQLEKYGAFAQPFLEPKIKPEVVKKLTHFKAKRYYIRRSYLEEYTEYGGIYISPTEIIDQLLTAGGNLDHYEEYADCMFELTITNVGNIKAIPHKVDTLEVQWL